MTDISNTTKGGEIAAKHKQVKVLVDAGIADAFKTACTYAGVSMASELSRFMAEYSKSAVKRKPSSKIEEASTRKKRRQIINYVTHLVELARDGEEAYRWRIPVNLQNSTIYESSEESSSVMDDIIDLLGAVY